MQDYKYSISFENKAIKGFADFQWNVSGAYTANFVIRATLFKGIKVFQDGQMIMSAAKDVFFDDVRIGKYPRFSKHIFKGYFGKYVSNNGIFEIRKAQKKTLNLFLDSKALGLIDLSDSAKGITFHLFEIPSLPDLLIIAWELWSMENRSFDD